MSWLGDILRNRRARKLVNKLAPVVIKLLAGDRSLRALAMENQDAAFDRAVRAAAQAAGLKLTDEQVTEVRLSVATTLLLAVAEQRNAEDRRHDKALQDLER